MISGKCIRCALARLVGSLAQFVEAVPVVAPQWCVGDALVVSLDDVVAPVKLQHGFSAGIYNSKSDLFLRSGAVDVRPHRRVGRRHQPAERLRAVTSISMRMRGSTRPAEIIVAAGRTSPRYLRITGQHDGYSDTTGKM